MASGRASGVARGGGLAQAVAGPVPLRDGRRVLVPVPGTGSQVVVVGRVGGVHRMPDPLDRLDLIHERTVRAVQREALAPIAPVVRLVRHAQRALTAVGAVSPQALARATRVHPEGELLLVLLDLERARVRPGARARVPPPRGGERVHDLPPVGGLDLIDVTPPAGLTP